MFTRLSKNFTADMTAAGVSLSAAGLYACLLSDPGTTALGYLYRKNEWEQFTGSNRDTVDRLLAELEAAGLVVADGYHLVIRGYMKRHAFDQPTYLRSGLYDLERLLVSPLLRFIIGTELLRLDLSEMPTPKATNVREAAAALWEEITGTSLPVADRLRGGEPDPMMLTALAAMPGADVILRDLDERRWAVIAAPLVVPLQREFTRLRSGESNVSLLGTKRGGRAAGGHRD
ncbi:hypothetical protein [Gordonia alkanivorans]|uniref:hypothetical protein n=1 Tax=Gordonia alkanivorans TaxID=84096 RepID=UPI0004AC7E5C|nr:hypothetical protein [Gordonia alkanivorans]